jgi:hypothetical protein
VASLGQIPPKKKTKKKKKKKKKKKTSFHVPNVVGIGLRQLGLFIKLSFYSLL